MKSKLIFAAIILFCLQAKAANVEFIKVQETGVPLQTALQICKTIAIVKFNDSIAEYQLNNPKKRGEIHIAWQDKAKRYATLKRNSALSSCLLEKGYVIKQ